MAATFRDQVLDGAIPNPGQLIRAALTLLYLLDKPCLHAFTLNKNFTDAYKQLRACTLRPLYQP